MTGQVVLITGCSSGIGRNLAERLSRAGYRVVATARRRELAPFGIQVVLIEPTSIRTEFAPTARAQAKAVMANPGSVYKALHRRMEQFLEQSYRSAPGPEAVSRVIQRAIEARRPRARYPVAGLAERMLPWLGDATLDRLIARLLGAGDPLPPTVGPRQQGADRHG